MNQNLGNSSSSIIEYAHGCMHDTTVDLVGLIVLSKGTSQKHIGSFAQQRSTHIVINQMNDTFSSCVFKLISCCARVLFGAHLNFCRYSVKGRPRVTVNMASLLLRCLFHETCGIVHIH